MFYFDSSTGVFSIIRRFCPRLSQALRGVPRKAWLSYLLLCVIFWWRFFYFLIKKKDFKSALHIYLGSWLYVKLGFLLPMKLFLDMSGGRFPSHSFWLVQHLVFYAYGVFIAVLALRWLDKNGYCLD